MRIRFIRDDIEVSKGVTFNTEKMVERGGRVFMKLGTESECDQRSVLIHVGNADAVPADSEAEELCQGCMTNWDRKLKAREALARRIHPDDMQDFMDDKIAGYNTDGSPIPGPQWEDEDEEDEDE